MGIGFDSKDFRRYKSLEEGKQIVFFSPLGVGVRTSNIEKLRSVLIENTLELNKSFKSSKSPVIQCSHFLIQNMGHKKAIPFFDKLIKSIEDVIDFVFISYVVLPPRTFPEVEVGGFHCPKIKMNTMDFLRSLSTYFSYITAWAYCGRYRENTCDMYIDSFSGRETTAWEDLKEYNLKVFSRGDECNELISLADIIACLTDKKLWDIKQWLKPDAIKEIWSSYDFDVEVRFLDDKILSKYKWFSDNQIDLDPFLAHPIVFLDLEQVNMKNFYNFNLYCDLTSYAFYKKGCIQGFDINIDSKKIRDGDIYVYAGQKAHERADMFSDMYDIKTLSIKELRKEIEEQSH